MGTLVISDTILLGPTIEESILNIEKIKKLYESGNRIVILSNKPSSSMKLICGKVKLLKGIKYFYDSNIKIDKGTIMVKLMYGNKVAINESIKYNLMIFGNGISIINDRDNLLYTSAFIDSDTLNNIKNIFKKNGYLFWDKKKRLIIWPRTYNYFNLDTGNNILSNKTCGMQCTSISKMQDKKIINLIKQENPCVICHSLDDKLHFSSDETTKLVAIEYLIYKGYIDPSNTRFYLSDGDDNSIDDSGRYKIDCSRIGENGYKSLYKALENNRC